jgi:hypothetical protein
LKTYPWLYYFALFSPLLPIIQSTFRGKFLEKEEKALVLLLLWGLIIDGLLIWLLKGTQASSFIMNIYTLIEFLLIMFIIYNWQSSKSLKKTIIGISFVYFLFWTIAKFTFEALLSPYYITGTISNSIIALCAGFTLFRIDYDNGTNLLKSTRFWILLAFIIYYSGTLVPIIVQGILYKQSREIFLLAWSINWILSIVANMLYSMGIFLKSKQAIRNSR